MSGRVYHFYNVENGEFSGRSFCAPHGEVEALLEINTPPGHKAYHSTGKVINPLQHRVDLVTGVVVNHMPNAPSDDHDWDANERVWKLRTEVLAHQQRSAVARTTITHLENNVQPRAQRELLLTLAARLGVDGGRLQDVDTQIAAQRTVLNEPKPPRPPPDQGH